MCIVFTLAFGVIFFFFNDTATTEIYPLSLHDALPISNSSAWASHFSRLGRRRKRGQQSRRRLTPSACACWAGASARDRKSTRLNSSHANISYAVFCLKKKQTRLYLPYLTMCSI